MVGRVKYEFRYVVLGPKGVANKEVILQPASPANRITNVFVTPGHVIFRVYVINPGQVRFMPGDAPYGTLFEFHPILVKKGRKSHLAIGPSLLSNYYEYMRKGMYYRSLIAIDAYTAEAFPNLGGEF